MNHETISSILQDCITEHRNKATQGFMLVGSYARGEATTHSDIDLTHFVYGQASPQTAYYLYDDYLLSLLTIVLPDEAALFNQPQSAIYALPMWRDAHILLDPTGAIQSRQQYALDFDWQQIQEIANTRASFVLYKKSEEVITLLRMLETDNLWGAEALRGFLLNWFATAVAMHYGILIRSEKTLYPDIIDRLGHTNPWSQTATQVVKSSALSSVIVRLFQETVKLLEDIIQPEHRSLIEFALNKIDKASL